jgi:DNA adenine methylase
MTLLRDHPMPKLMAPFPWFGGKSKIAREVWSHFGQVRNYVEPFAGSLAVLLLRPCPFEGKETINDIDGHVSNFWRALRSDPEKVAYHADWPVIENDLHARHAWLVGQKNSLQTRLEGDPDFFDAKIAGWWVWGVSCWIGGEFCSGKGPWHVQEVDGVKHLIRSERNGNDDGNGISHQRIHLHQLTGVNRESIKCDEEGVPRRRIDVHFPRGIKSQRASSLLMYLGELSDRLKHVRVCCGDWSRVCTNTPTTLQGLTAIFLDPPYSESAGRNPNTYTCESLTVAKDVLRWCLEHGDDPKLRIAFCGYKGEHHLPGWTAVDWKTKGGLAHTSNGSCKGKANANKERVWFSPHCLDAGNQDDEMFRK